MTPLLKDPERRDVGKNEKPGLSLPLWGDFQDTLGDFWNQTGFPVTRMLSHTISVLWRQAFIPSIQNWMISSGERLRRLLPGKAPVRSVASPSPMPMLRIHGALGERWASEKNYRPIVLNQGKQNPWIAAERKVSVLKKPPVPPTLKREHVTLANAAAVEDEIRGLDDIFTGPVQESFLDVLKAPGRSSKPEVTLPPERGPGKEPGRISGDDWRARPEPAKATADQPGANPRMEALTRNQEALREEARKLGSRVKNIAESTQDWFSKTEPMSEPDESALATVAEIPYVSYAAETVTAFAPAQPQANVQPMMKAPPPEAAKPTPVTAQEPPQKVLQEKIPAPAPQPETAKVAPPPVQTPRPKPPELSYELADDLQGVEYMIQNNRILSNSISNLVDRYFHQAALEEEPNYY